jgi:ADP-ribosyl-[dinitrogen reductase] hydrolase
MIDNTDLLRTLFAQNRIRMQAAPFLYEAPEPLPGNFDFDRVDGMLLGLAIGDALGNTSESQLPSERKAAHGEIRSYLPNRSAGNQPKGLPSDDTQMAFWTLEQMLKDGGLVPDNLAKKFCDQPIFGIGSAVRAFISAYKDRRIPWEEAGQDSAGNGALMRIAPVIVPHLRRPQGLWADAALAGMLTHNDFASNTACVAFIYLLWEILHLKTPPSPEWWLETFCHIASQLEGETRYQPRIPGWSYQGPIWKFTRAQVEEAASQGMSTLDACNYWRSGAYLMETIPSVLYILARCGNDPEEAILRAVNDTWDNDTVAAIVGAAVGALHGKQSLPGRWVNNLLGRTGTGDDGKIFSLIQYFHAIDLTNWYG